MKRNAPNTTAGLIYTRSLARPTSHNQANRQGTSLLGCFFVVTCLGLPLTPPVCELAFDKATSKEILNSRGFTSATHFRSPDDLNQYYQRHMAPMARTIYTTMQTQTTPPATLHSIGMGSVSCVTENNYSCMSLATLWRAHGG